MQELNQEFQMVFSIMPLIGEEYIIMCQCRNLILVIHMHSVMNLPAIHLFGHPMTCHLLRVLSKRTFGCVHLILLHQTSFLTCSPKCKQQGMSHILLIQTGFICIMQIMLIFTEIVMTFHIVMLGSTGGHQLCLLVKFATNHFFFCLCSCDLELMAIFLSGPCYQDSSRVPYATGPYTCPRQRSYRDHRWAHPSRPMNYRDFLPHRTPSEGPLPVTSRGMLSSLITKVCLLTCLFL